ncbi:cupin domain-containing protein [Polaribacter sp.]|uniref:cupin domain-containing protein n=1 Tax=Polaribacter sp. TaxID=1920175 RepID=UPI003F6B0367
MKISEIEQKEIIKGFKGRFLHTASFTIAFWEIDAGSILPLHSHIHEQTTQVIEGEFEMTLNGETKRYTPGTILSIPSNAEHQGKAITNCKITDIFSPVREDYK